jgi:hypothetical protein
MICGQEWRQSVEGSVKLGDVAVKRTMLLCSLFNKVRLNFREWTTLM